MKSILRRIRVLVALAVVLAIGVLVTERTVDVPFFGCDTELCCVDCPQVEVVRIIDGDTFRMPDGNRFRPYGFDAHEVGERCASEATSRFSELVGNVIRVDSGPREFDPFGRRLGYAYSNAGSSIDEIMIREGLAVAWTQDGQHRDYLIAVEQEARNSRRGCMWR